MMVAAQPEAGLEPGQGRDGSDAGPCVLCTQAVPQCECARPDACTYVKQSCRHCAHYDCMPVGL